MPKAWGFMQRKEYWAAFFSTTGSPRRRMPLLWTCHQNQEQERLLREQAQIYDPFVGIAVPKGVVTCLGVLATCGYESPHGFTVELLPKEVIPNPIPVSRLVAAAAFPQGVGTKAVEDGILQPLESSHWVCFKKILAETNPLLVTSLASLENWHQRQRFLDHILEIIAQRGCVEEEEQEVFTVLRALLRAEPEDQASSPSDQMALQTRLRVALKAQLLTAREWEQLWKSLVDAWYGYAMTLTPSEVARLIDLNLTFYL